MRAKTVALIPARSGSKGVPKKNIKLLGKFPLIAYSIAACHLSKKIDETIISTDNKEIANIAKKYGGNVPFLRPKNISQDNSTDIEFVIHTINWFKKKRGFTPLNWVIIRPTTPLRDPKIIDKSINYLHRNPQATSLVSIHEIPETPAKMFGMQDGYLHGLCPLDPRPEYYILPRQEFPPTYSGNGYVDIIKTSTVQKTNSFYGSKILGFKTADSGEVDVKDDFKKLEFNLKTKKNYLERYLIEKYYK